MNKRLYRFGGVEVEVDAELSPEEVKQVWSEVYPGLANSQIEAQEDGSVNFVTRAGEKG